MSVIPTAEPQKTVITVCVPAHDRVHALWAHDFAGMMTYTAAAIGDRVAIRLSMMTNTYIQRARQELVEEALEKGTHYILFVDADMRFPKDALIRLLAREKPVVGINYSTRRVPSNFIALKQEKPELGGFRSNRCPTFEDSTGLEKVWATGGGLLLLKATVFQNLPKPWFHLEYNDEDGSIVGEDVYFCRLLGEHGWDVFIDHDLSKMVCHMGDFDYKVIHAEEVWRMEEEQDESGHIRESQDGDRDAPQPD